MQLWWILEIKVNFLGTNSIPRFYSETFHGGVTVFSVCLDDIEDFLKIKEFLLLLIIFGTTDILLDHALQCFKVTATALKLEIRLHTHQVGLNTRSGTEVIFTLIWLAHAFGTRLLCTKSYFRRKRWHSDFKAPFVVITCSIKNMYFVLLDE